MLTMKRWLVATLLLLSLVSGLANTGHAQQQTAQRDRSTTHAETMARVLRATALFRWTIFAAPHAQRVDRLVLADSVTVYGDSAMVRLTVRHGEHVHRERYTLRRPPVETAAWQGASVEIYGILRGQRGR